MLARYFGIAIFSRSVDVGLRFGVFVLVYGVGRAAAALATVALRRCAHHAPMINDQYKRSVLTSDGQDHDEMMKRSRAVNNTHQRVVEFKACLQSVEMQ